MRGTLAVFHREWLGRRNAFLVATVVGCLFLVHAWLNRGGQPGTAALTTGTVMMASLIFVWVFAAIHGANMIGKDVEERRFGFFLNRPLHGAEILWGKVAAGLLMAVLLGVATSLPWLLLGGGWRQVAWKDGAILAGLWLVGGLFLVLLLHVLSIQVRSRSAWLLLDFAVWMNFLGGSYLLARHLIGAGAWNGAARLVLGLFALATLGLALAAQVQVARGRVDLRRGHRALSLALAACLGTGLLAGWAYSAWVLALRPGDLREARASLEMPRGDWFLVVGKARGRGEDRFTLLMNARSGTSLRVGQGLLAQSGNGGRVAWVELNAFGPRVLTADLREASPRPEVVPIDLLGLELAGCRLVLSEEGRRLALFSRGRYQVLDLPSGKLLASGPSAEDPFYMGAFLGETRLRAYFMTPGPRETGPRMLVQDLDLAKGRGAVPSPFPDARGLRGWDVRGDRLILLSSLSPGTRRLTERLWDGGAGRPLADLGSYSHSAIRFLEDGRIIQGLEASSLRLLDRDGQELWRLDLGEGYAQPRPHGRLPDGRLLVEARAKPSGAIHQLAVDLGTRKVDLLARDLQGTPLPARPGPGPLLAGGLAGRLFRSAAGDLVLEDFQGPRHVVIPAGHLATPER